MPTNGAKSFAVGGKTRTINIKPIKPMMAAKQANNIFSVTEPCGISNVTNNKPKAAACVVPVIDGSTKRLRISICIIKPAFAIDMPVRITEAVRGIRLAKKTSRAASSVKSVWIDTSLTPMKRLLSTKSRKLIIITARNIIDDYLCD